MNDTCLCDIDDDDDDVLEGLVILRLRNSLEVHRVSALVDYKCYRLDIKSNKCETGVQRNLFTRQEVKNLLSYATYIAFFFFYQLRKKI